MLNTPVVLHGVDIEAQCHRVATGYCTKTRTRLSAADMEDLVSYLIFCAWQLGEKYDPTTFRSSFRAYLAGLLPYRATDWQRKHLGRSRWTWADHSYVRERPNVLSLDRPINDDDSGPLGDTIPDRTSDGSADRDEAPLWIQSLGDSTRAADTALLRAESRRRARARAQRKRAERG